MSVSATLQDNFLLHSVKLPSYEISLSMAISWQEACLPFQRVNCRNSTSFCFKTMTLQAPCRIRFVLFERVVHWKICGRIVVLLRKLSVHCRVVARDVFQKPKRIIESVASNVTALQLFLKGKKRVHNDKFRSISLYLRMQTKLEKRCLRRIMSNYMCLYWVFA